MGIFRRRGAKHGLAVAMTGVALGDRLLMIGCTEASLLGAICSKVGLSGRACAIVANEVEAACARRGAENAGALVEVETGFDRFPFEDSAFNLIVIDDQNGILSAARPEVRVSMLQHAFRTLAARGRIVVIERGERGGLGALLKTSNPAGAADPHYRSGGGAIGALQAEGFRAARLLAERDGLSFFEGVR